MGGKRTLKIGDLMGTVVIPFKKLETEEDYESLVEVAQNAIDFFAENACTPSTWNHLTHHRILKKASASRFKTPSS